ncbi:hypothetical protein [Stenotrophomonas sp. STK17_22]
MSELNITPYADQHQPVHITDRDELYSVQVQHNELMSHIGGGGGEG